MASDPTCWGGRSVIRWRIALLVADSGAPATGSTNGYCSSSVVSIVATPQVEAGDEFTLKNGDGDICQYYATPDRIKRVDPVLSVCQIDPTAEVLLVGGDLWNMGSSMSGMQIAQFEDDPIPVSLEWWTRAWDGSSQATLASAPVYWHHVIPMTYFVNGAITSEHGLETRVYNGKGSQNPNITGNGPFNDWPAVIATTDGATAAYARWPETSVPVASCDPISVTSSAS